MSKQLAVSAAFSILMMATYVLFGAHLAREALAPTDAAFASPLEISAPELPRPSSLLPIAR
ncbi:hypothetical protein KRR38_24625 [Novosphingobium sp. G106]|uniref:hypothetical protein n=1 Tax=Novosphingobium sp. G106 TaxID=2849500 RepID=UPI001C2CF41D|nr:hypothetical protein [Novosphingobium sp. G106]MBV1690775.1 hypothetical protein [Novosphingobium sp. G106]